MAVTFFKTFSSKTPQQMQINTFIDEVDNVDYRYEAIRLESFKTWPVLYIKPERLAAAGFYFTGKGDSVKCFDCHLELYKWMEGDDPMMDHKRLSPMCRFICNVTCDNVSIGFDLNTILSLTKEDTSVSGSYDMEREWFTIGLEKAEHPYYCYYEFRIETFGNWPTSKTQTKQQLAEAGFFYTNTNDHVLCFYCGLGLSNWKENENPWEMHAFWMSNCFYLLQIKGQGYVDSLDQIFAQRYFHKIEMQQSQDAEATFESIIEENSASNCGTCNIRSDVESISDSISALSVEDESNITKLHTKTSSSTSIAEPLLCQICFVNQRSVLFMTCQHLVSCTECSRKLNNKCPICRQHISYMLPVSFA